MEIYSKTMTINISYINQSITLPEYLRYENQKYTCMTLWPDIMKSVQTAKFILKY
jgi:hypothetical protein